MYLQAWQTLLSFYNSWKMFRSSRHSRGLWKIIQKYLQAFTTSGKCLGSPDTPGVLSNDTKIVTSFYSILKMVRLSTHSRSLLKIVTSLIVFPELLQLLENVWDLQALQESFKNHIKIFTSLPVILKILQLQKNVWELQALQESLRSHTKILSSLTDILEVLQLQKNV